MFKLGVVCLTVVLLGGGVVHARTWQDASGKYSVVGDLLARSADQAVIKRKNGRLVAIKIKDLSEKDQEYLRSKEAESETQAQAKRMQTWTFRRGYQASGRVVDYIRKDVVVGRQRAQPYVNNRPLENFPEVYQLVVRRIVSHFEDTPIETNRELEKWLQSQGNQPHKYTVEGVVLELENGDKYAIPFFMFSDTDQELLKPGWERWNQAKDDEEAKAKERFLLEAQARGYEQQQRQAQQQTQIAQLELALLAAAPGGVELWEVALYPRPGVNAYPLSVVVPGANTNVASAQAMQRYPGYVVGEVRRVSY
ncbi:MAG: SHD1 domain-containing protein [Aureliella sp.]